ncbi:MAG: FxsA family protein [Acidimicrobiales bacterium]
MFPLLLLAFIVVPIAEIYVIIQVGVGDRGWNTIGLFCSTAWVGAWLVRREGFSILAQVQQSLACRRLPTNPLIDGLLVLVAGALMLTPGFLTDGVGLLLLARRCARSCALPGAFAGRVQVSGVRFGPGPGGGVTDVGSSDVTDRPEPPGAIELGPIDD